jgi:hypothetical protein
MQARCPGARVQTPIWRAPGQAGIPGAGERGGPSRSAPRAPEGAWRGLLRLALWTDPGPLRQNLPGGLEEEVACDLSHRPRARDTRGAGTERKGCGISSERLSPDVRPSPERQAGEPRAPFVSIRGPNYDAARLPESAAATGRSSRDSSRADRHSLLVRLVDFCRRESPLGSRTSQPSPCAYPRSARRSR